MLSVTWSRCDCLLATVISRRTDTRPPPEVAATEPMVFCWSPAAKTIAANSGCPSSVWKDIVSPSMLHSEMTFVNVGANKGFAVADFLQRFGAGHWRGATNEEWRGNLTTVKASTKSACGVCDACKAPMPTITHRTTQVHVYAMELLPANAWLLRRMFERMQIRSGTVTNAAVGNREGIAYTSRSYRTGEESKTACMQPPTGHVTPKGTQVVNATTLDAFLLQKGVERVDWLQIDAEGWDSLVLEGTVGLLSTRRVGLLEFEVRDWRQCSQWQQGKLTTLATALSWLNEPPRGYKCFWQGHDGWLAAAPVPSAACAHEYRKPGGGFGNMVCAHQPRVLEQLRTLTVR